MPTIVHNHCHSSALSNKAYLTCVVNIVYLSLNMTATNKNDYSLLYDSLFDFPCFFNCELICVLNISSKFLH